jgi:dihydropyrimidinase
MDILIKNGTVINADGRMEADVLVRDGKIAAVEPRGTAGIKTEVVDASGLFVLPGAIDVHTHFELPYSSSCGTTASADDFFTGTRAAACGGVTMVIDFVSPDKGEGLMDAFRDRNALAEPKVCIDYGLHMGISELTDSVVREMADVAAAGVPSFKVFMTYAFRITDDEFRRALTRAKELGAVIMVHAESHNEIEALKAEFIAAGKTDAWHHYLSRPESVEAKGVVRAVELAKSTDASLYIVHLACADGLKAVERARLDGYSVFAETCPQYLNFTCDVYKRPDSRNFVCSPPMKGQESRDALWLGIKNGSISTVATDHCPFMSSEKEWGRDDFTKIPNGVMGVENSYPYMLSEANKGRISFERVVELCCSNPARLFGCAVSAKGVITPGADADIVLYDPAKNFTISHKNMHSNVDYTIWEGVELKGYPVRTYSRGTLVYKDGEFLGKAGHGRFVKRGCVSK